MALTNVLRPIRINQVEVKNRIFRSGHGTYYGKGGISDRLIAYHEARAKAGVGLTTLEVAVVHPSSASNATVYAWDDAIIDGFKRISKMAHNHGMALFTQLWHGGHHWPPVDGTPAWGPSVTPSPWGFVPLEMDHEKIATITKAFADAAVRARAGGLDGVELHFGHGYLIHQFFSPLINVREDEYGGSLANRMRFGAEVLRAVRKEVGTDFAVGIRISDQHTPDGLSVSECAEIVRAYCAEKLVDFVNGSMGSYHDVPSMLPAMDAPVGAMMPSAGPIVAAADVVRMVAGRFQTLEDADEIIRSGQADMVAIVRGMIADPDLVAKSVAGKAEDVRPCIACNQGCVGGILGPDPGIRCTVNAVVGMEATLGEHLITKSAMPKKVVVVGGGPSGLEAARLAATAGHKVVLFEATNKLGGAVNIARRAPKLAAIGDITLWLERQIYGLNVDVRLSTYAEDAEILGEEPDVVLIATGAAPRMDLGGAANPNQNIPGAERASVLSSRDLFDLDKKERGVAAVVFDDTGHYDAIAAAEYLIEAGLSVTFATRMSSFAPKVEGFVRTEPALRRLRRGNFSFFPRAKIQAVEEGVCRLAFLEGGEPWSVAADHVVFAGYAQPNRDVFNLLSRRSGNRVDVVVKCIGDAQSPGDLQSAIFSGHMAGRFVDAPA